MNVVVAGLGYVGLPTAAGLASLGHDVVGVDIDPNRVAAANRGEVPIAEPGIEPILRKGLAEGSLSFSSDWSDASGSSIALICVGTPSDDQGHADLGAVWSVVDALAASLPDQALVVTKSTVPAGTGEAIRSRLDTLGRTDLGVASNPEFLRQGRAAEDFLHPDRIVVGVSDPGAAESMKSLYGPITSTGVPILVTDVAAAELIKYASNAYLAMRIAYTNELADLCEGIGASIEDVVEGVGLDNRITAVYMNPGPGFGGSCFPKDTEALLHAFDGAGTNSRLISAAVRSNRERRAGLADRVLGIVRQPRRVAVWGLAFKAGTDDTRESPALDLVSALLGRGIEVVAYDPEVSAVPAIPDLSIAPDAVEAVRDADALVVATEWPEFSDIDPNAVSEAMAGSTVIDLRNTLDPEAIASSGLDYFPVGKPPHHSTHGL